ncbi:hypothetical protein [Jiella sp. M17.18]|uniref:hypothetical protein n=1 Tax=Jiella sp. M17.18 TaxID=3234247 RepID=UPI0034DFC973
MIAKVLLAVILSLGWTLVGGMVAAAQQVPAASVGGGSGTGPSSDLPDNHIAPGDGKGTPGSGPQSRQKEYNLTMIVMIAALLLTAAFVAMYFVGRGSDEFSRYYLAIIVVIAALFLMTAGYNENQTAPAFGLLGTILGYIFGKIDGRRGSPEHQSQTPDGATE